MTVIVVLAVTVIARSAATKQSLCYDIACMGAQETNEQNTEQAELQFDLFSWYPGHIAKAERQLKEKIKAVDIIIELRDARIPEASAHQDLDEWANPAANRKTEGFVEKPILVVFTKSDLADPYKLKPAIQKYNAIEVDAKKGKLGSLMKRLDKAAEPVRAKFKAKGVLNRPARIMVVGYPNVGKSSLINKLAKKKKAKVENRPGVTRQQQWVDLPLQSLKLLDTPGIIPTKLYSKEQALKLALCNCLGDKSFDHVPLAREVISFIDGIYPGAIAGYYGLTEDEELNLENIALKRSWLQVSRDGDRYPDLERAGTKVLNDCRDLKFGRVSFDT